MDYATIDDFREMQREVARLGSELHRHKEIIKAIARALDETHHSGDVRLQLQITREAKGFFDAE